MLSFGQRLKLLRSEAGISQSDLAEALGTSAQSVSKWERDLYLPDVSMLLPLSVVLGVTTDCLLGAGTNEKEDKEELYRLTEKMNETRFTLRMSGERDIVMKKIKQVVVKPYGLRTRFAISLSLSALLCVFLFLLLYHLAPNGSCLAGREVAVVAVRKVYS